MGKIFCLIIMFLVGVSVPAWASFLPSAVNGNVGIGTVLPGQKMEVVGTVKATAFTGDGSALTNIVPTPAGSTQTFQYNNGGTQAGAANLVYETASGNVGVGSSSPVSSLNVVGNVVIRGSVEIDLQ
jgi:hypothetical protein